VEPLPPLALELPHPAASSAAATVNAASDFLLVKAILSPLASGRADAHGFTSPSVTTVIRYHQSEPIQ
jgi:hypothetical protein